MAKLVDATDLIGLSLGMETYWVIIFKFRETLELIIKGNPEPNPIFPKTKRKAQKAKKKKKDRCRDSTEAVLTNGVDCVGREIFPSKIPKGWRRKVYTYGWKTVSNDSPIACRSFQDLINQTRIKRESRSACQCRQEWNL